MLARGSLAKPTFERIALAGRTDAVISLQPVGEGVLLPGTGDGAKAPRSSGRAVSVLGPENAAEALIPRPAAENGGAARKRREPEAPSANGDGSAPSGGDPRGIGGGDGSEPSLWERLRALEVSNAGGMDVDAETPAGAARSSLPAGRGPRADSLGVLLSQALRAEDRGMLEKCLGVSDDAVVVRTVRALQPEEAVAFLAIVVEKLQSKPQRGVQLARWIRAVLIAHASYLMSAPASRTALTALFQIIDARLATFRPLLELSGRLDLLLAQQLTVEEGGLVGAADPATRGPAVQYVEEEDGDVRVEHIGAAADDDAEGEDEEDEEDEEMDEDDDEEGGEDDEDESEWETDDDAA